MRNCLAHSVAIAVGATLALATPAAAEDEPNADRVLATVNGTDITLGHMIVLRSSLPQQYADMPAEVLFNGVLDQLIQQTLLADTMDGEISRRSALVIENERRAIIADEAIRKVMDDVIDSDMILEAYEARYAEAEPETEYNASHILVETEDEATALIEELEEGADFAALAQEHSTGPSAANGGELGWFGEGMMVPAFFEPVAALAVGDISEPVQTEFGWHVIKLNETRNKERPSLEDARDEIEQELRQIAFEDYVESLEEDADIDRMDASDLDPEALDNTDLLEN